MSLEAEYHAAVTMIRMLLLQLGGSFSWTPWDEVEAKKYDLEFTSYPDGPRYVIRLGERQQ